MFCDSFCKGGSCWESEDDRTPLNISLNTAPGKERTSGDALIADALKNLSLKDRERVYHDVHGVADAIEETSDFAANCLSQMQEQLIALREDTNSRLPCQAIQLAEQQDEEFVNDPKLRVMFLRAEHFHAKRVAARMIRFFDLKLLLFGESKLYAS
jgi:hypothetical protein